MKTQAISPFTETLGQALEAVRTECVNERAVVNDDSWLDAFSFGGMAYNTKKEAHCELVTYKDKPTRKWVHATIYRFESGRYEWTVYFL